MKQITFDENDVKKLIRVDSRASKFWRLFWRTARQAGYLIILFLFFFYALNYSAYLKRFQYSVNAHSVQKVAVTPPAPTPVLPDYAPELDIPKLSITAPLSVNVADTDIIANLKHGVVQYLDTALPGQIGNMVIVGHSSDYPWSDGKFKTVFAVIDKLAVGDQIIVPYHDQKFIYEVTASKVVKPTDLSVLKKTDTPTLTLLTCYPVGTTRSRYLVLAKLVSNNISGTQSTEPNATAVPSPR